MLRSPAYLFISHAVEGVGARRARAAHDGVDVRLRLQVLVRVRVVAAGRVVGAAPAAQQPLLREVAGRVAEPRVFHHAAHWNK